MAPPPRGLFAAPARGRTRSRSDRPKKNKRPRRVSRRVDGPWTDRGTAAAATWIVRGGAACPRGPWSRRRRVSSSVRAGSPPRATPSAPPPRRIRGAGARGQRVPPVRQGLFGHARLPEEQNHVPPGRAEMVSLLVLALRWLRGDDVRVLQENDAFIRRRRENRAGTALARAKTARRRRRSIQLLLHFEWLLDIQRHMDPDAFEGRRLADAALDSVEIAHHADDVGWPAARAASSGPGSVLREDGASTCRRRESFIGNGRRPQAPVLSRLLPHGEGWPARRPPRAFI